MLDFRKRLTDPDLIILDGAMGTMLEVRGISTEGPAWSARALLETPESISSIHREYIEAGAEIITANTFRTQQRSIGKQGWAGRALELTQKAVFLAKEAALQSDTDVFVAGSMAPLEDCYRPDLVPSRKDLELEHLLHAENLAIAGVDFLLIETMNSIQEAEAAANAAKRVGLPYGVSFVCNDAGDLLSGESLGDAMVAIEPNMPDFVGINCVPSAVLNHSINNLVAATNLPIAAYGNIGFNEDFPVWHSTRDYNFEEYSEETMNWRSSQLKFLGGCCGTQPGHIHSLHSAHKKEI
jgi:S-methylmethionine-dependent homocysteine/selenocysteine methylase